MGQRLRRDSVCDWCVCRRMDSRGLEGHSSRGRVCEKAGMYLLLLSLTPSLTAGAGDVFPPLTLGLTISLYDFCLTLARPGSDQPLGLWEKIGYEQPTGCIFITTLQCALFAAGLINTCSAVALFSNYSIYSWSCFTPKTS